MFHVVLYVFFSLVNVIFSMLIVGTFDKDAVDFLHRICLFILYKIKIKFIR